MTPRRVSTETMNLFDKSFSDPSFESAQVVEEVANLQTSFHISPVIGWLATVASIVVFPLGPLDPSSIRPHS